jgi:putative peptide maturation dehydrogenase
MQGKHCAASPSMKLRHAAFVVFEHRVTGPRPLSALVGTLATGAQWFALAAHLDAEVPVTLADIAVLDAMPADGDVAYEVLAARVDPARLAFLVDEGLLLGDHPAHAAWRARDARLRAMHWWPLAAIAQRQGRWEGVDVGANAQEAGELSRLLASNGAPPSAEHQVVGAGAPLPLPAPASEPLDALLAARATCRNFDTGATVSLSAVSTVLWRAFGAQAAPELAPGATMLKKHSPSGGALHPVEAFVIAQRVDGLPPGLYHYGCVAHALSPMPMPRGLFDERASPEAAAAGLRAAALDLVAGQGWFADAPVIVVLAARFERNFWKYRRHPKAWRVVQLDAGHASQTLQLAATEQGLGAFVTAAVNDACAEALFALDGISIGTVAVCGFGPRSRETRTFEFDPGRLASQPGARP